MDHHCPWTLNCIGAHNHAHFLRFLIYVVLADLTVFVFLCRRIYSIYLIAHLSSIHGPSTKELVFLILTIFSSFVTLLLVSILMGYQIWSVIENMTTIEALEKQHVESWVEKHHAQEFEFPYNTTLSSNFAIVFGSDHPLLWLWPWNRTSHDGLDYPIVEDADVPWPPPQTLPNNDLAPPTAELPWSSSRSYTSGAVSRLRRPYTPDEESGESELDSDDEEQQNDLFDGWFGMEDMEEYGVDIESEVRGLRKEEEGIVWKEVLRRRREEE
jgi:DHHC palmitoyltransferase